MDLTAIHQGSLHLDIELVGLSDVRQRRTWSQHNPYYLT